jgi:hypothetical protein
METIKPEALQIYESNKAMIDSQVATAKQYPRNVKDVLDACVTVVTYNEEIAKSCIYSVPRGVKRISGPSINLAKIIMQQFGNFRAEARVVDEDAKRITCEGVAFDIQNNVAVKVQVKRLIWGSTGRFNEDMITLTGNAGNSIALRNAIFAVIPKSIVDIVYNAAIDTAAGKIKNENELKAKRTLLINGFKDRYNVTQEEVLKSIGRETVDHVTKEDIITMIGIETAIKEGDTTVDMVFRPEKVKKQQREMFDSPREQRLIEQIRNCGSQIQLNALKPNCKTEKEKAEWNICFNKLQKQPDNGINTEKTDNP